GIAMLKRLWIAVVLAGIVLPSKGTAQDHSIVLADDVVWQPLPLEWIVGTIPPGTTVSGEIAIIHGDPNKAGERFVVRIKSPPNTVLPAHWHDFDEYVTVLEGVWCMG